MTNIKRDSNNIPVFSGLSDSDGVTILPVKASGHAIIVDDGELGSDLSSKIQRDENSITTVMAVSSTDGNTLVPLYINHLTGGLLIKST